MSTVYRSSNEPWRRNDADAAREILATHVPDQETNLCVVCLTHGPCRPANAAANRLVELGHPVLPPQEPKRRRNSWRGWLTAPRRRPTPRTAPLLTFVWLIRLGLATTATAGQPSARTVAS